MDSRTDAWHDNNTRRRQWRLWVKVSSTVCDIWSSLYITLKFVYRHQSLASSSLSRSDSKSIKIYIYFKSYIQLGRKTYLLLCINPDSKVHGASMGPTWALSVPDGPHVGPMNLAIRVLIQKSEYRLHGFYDTECRWWFFRHRSNSLYLG